MTDILDKIYTSLNNKYACLNRLRVYSMLRLIVRLVANIVLPAYFYVTRGCKAYRIEPTVKTQGRIIVTLTSFPVRTGRLWLVIETILRQTIKPDMIVLWLSSKQYNGWEDIPQSLKSLQKRGLTIRFVPEDYRSHKKYHYCLVEFPDDHIITIDDDIFYDTHLVERLIQMHNNHPYDIIANKTHRIKFDSSGNLLPYSKWEQNTNGGSNLFAVGAGGTLYPAHSLDNMASDIDMAMKLTPTGDDIWLNAMLRLNHRKVIHAQYHFIEQISVLNLHNVELITGNANSGNDYQIKQLMTYLTSIDRENPFLPDFYNA